MTKVAKNSCEKPFAHACTLSTVAMSGLIIDRKARKIIGSLSTQACNHMNAKKRDSAFVNTGNSLPHY